MLIDKLQQLNACDNAIDWVALMNGDNPEQLWLQCERGDWMLWLVGKLDIDRKRLVLAACQCARLSLHLAKGNEARIAIEVAEAWVQGRVTLEQVSIARAAAWAAEATETAEATEATETAEATEAARAAAWAAEAAAWATEAARAAEATEAARAAAWAAEATEAAGAAEATEAAGAAARAAAWATTEKETFVGCANITRQYFTYEEVAEALEL
jgi:hypothetical protein